MYEKSQDEFKSSIGVVPPIFYLTWTPYGCFGLFRNFQNTSLESSGVVKFHQKTRCEFPQSSEYKSTKNRFPAYFLLWLYLNWCIVSSCLFSKRLNELSMVYYGIFELQCSIAKVNKTAAADPPKNGESALLRNILVSPTVLLLQ